MQAVGLREAAPNEVHQRLILEVFESLDLLPVDRGGEGDATPNGSAVYQDRAGPTDAMLAGKVRRSEIQFIAYKSADRLPRIDSGADALAVDREFDAAHADNASMMLRDTVAACVLASNGSGSTPASRRSSSKAARIDRKSTRLNSSH